MVAGAVVVIRNMNVREIFDAVLRGEPFFEPDNREVTRDAFEKALYE